MQKSRPLFWLFRGLGVLIALVVVLFAIAFTTPSRQLKLASVPPADMDLKAAVGRLAEAVRFPTVSTQDQTLQNEAFAGLHAYLQASFPRVHEELALQIVGDWSLVYRWQGKNLSLPPILLLAHLDVVPVEPGSLELWEEQPFSGTVKDGSIWGRGTLDDKANVLAQLEAVEHLLARGFQTERTIYLAFGEDEEVGGEKGARKIAALLAERGVRPEFVLDEGMMIVDRRAYRHPVAFVGVAEKGFVSLELIAHGAGGHSSLPPRDPAVEILARALVRLREHPMPVEMGIMNETYRYLGPEMGLGYRLLLNNRWLLAPLLRAVTVADYKTEAMVRTTIAPTMLEGSPKDNVLPTTAKAVVNFRVHPGDSIAEVEERVRETLDDARIEIRRHSFASEPSAISPTDGSGFQLIQRTLAELAPQVVVAPALVVGGTDARHYGALTSQVYRFSPVRLHEDELKRFHGVNERLEVSEYGRAIQFYIRLLENQEHL